MKSVTITANEDGSFMVSQEMPEAMEGAEMQPEMQGAPEAPEGQQAASIDEALDMARQMLQDDGRSEEQAMMDGYNKGGKPAMNAKPGLQQVFGE